MNHPNFAAAQLGGLAAAPSRELSPEQRRQQDEQRRLQAVAKTVYDAIQDRPACDEARPAAAIGGMGGMGAPEERETLQALASEACCVLQDALDCGQDALDRLRPPPGPSPALHNAMPGADKVAMPPVVVLLLRLRGMAHNVLAQQREIRGIIS